MRSTDQPPPARDTGRRVAAVLDMAMAVPGSARGALVASALLAATATLLGAGSGCAEGRPEEFSVAPDPDGAPLPGLPDAGPSPEPDATPQRVASDCPSGEFATGFAIDGGLECAPIDNVATSVFEESCRVYAGWAGGCDGCTSPPTKWGHSGGSDCAVGTGANCICTEPTLDERQVGLFGLNPEGHGTDDTLHVGFRCERPDDLPSSPCAPGQFLTSSGASGVECVTGRAAIAASLQSNCELFYGYRPDCLGCDDPPVAWGRVATNGCTVGAGADTTCSEAVLGEVSVHLLGIYTPESIEDPDKLYIGLRCTAAAPTTSINDSTCPDGQLVVGIDDNGRVHCASPAPRAHDVIESDCFVYHGQRDRCTDCTDPPTAWGRTNTQSCLDGLGEDNSCSVAELAGDTVRLFGLDVEGTINGDDKLYYGLSCE